MPLNFGALAQTVEIGLAFVDSEGIIRAANETLCRMLGYEEVEIAGLSLEQLSDPDELSPQLLSAAHTQRRLRAKDGSVVPVRLTSFACNQPGANPGRFTVLERLPDPAVQSTFCGRRFSVTEEGFRWILESSHIGIAEVCLRGEVLCANDSLLRLLGVSRTEFAEGGLDMRDVTAPSWFPEGDENVRHCFRSRQSVACEKELLTRHGTRVPVQIVLCWSGTAIDRAFVFIFDLTDQKRNEHKLETLESWLRSALKAAQAGVWERNLETGELVWSDELHELYGLDPTVPVTPQRWASYIAPEHRSSVLQAVQDALSHGHYDVRFRATPPGRSFWVRSKGTCQFDQDGRPIRFAGVAMDITAGIQIEEELAAANRRLRSYLESSPLAVVEWGADLRLSSWGGAAARIFGWLPQEVVGKRFGEWRFVHQDDEAATRDVLLRIINRRPGGAFLATRHYTKDGRLLYCEWHNSAFADEDGRVESILCLVLDVSAQTRMRQALIESEERYRTLVEAIPGIVFTADANGRNTFMNSHFEQFTGMSSAQSRERGWTQALHEDDRVGTAQALAAAAEQRKPYQMEYRFRRHDGVYRWFEARGVPQSDSDGHIGRWIGICTEIEKQKQIKARLETLVLHRTKALHETVEKLQAALAEKTVLLKEVHHRVKNNMAVIASLLSRQAEGVDDPVAVRLLEDSRRRVQAMALVHEHLYSAEQFDRVNFADYLREFVNQLSGAMLADNRRVRVLTDAEPVDLGVDRAIPCALIINELTTNSLKYAFPGDRGGDVRVSFRALPGNRAVLIVRDDGAGGVPVDWRQSNTLGLTIVRLLAKQLDGSLELLPGPGTAFRLEFPASG